MMWGFARTGVGKVRWLVGVTVLLNVVGCAGNVRSLRVQVMEKGDGPVEGVAVELTKGSARKLDLSSAWVTDAGGFATVDSVLKGTPAEITLSVPNKPRFKQPVTTTVGARDRVVMVELEFLKESMGVDSVSGEPPGKKVIKHGQ